MKAPQAFITDRPFRYVYCLRENVQDRKTLYQAGFYFLDQALSFVGPLRSLDIARKELALAKNKT